MDSIFISMGFLMFSSHLYGGFVQLDIFPVFMGALLGIPRYCYLFVLGIVPISMGFVPFVWGLCSVSLGIVPHWFGDIAPELFGSIVPICMGLSHLVVLHFSPRLI